MPPAKDNSTTVTGRPYNLHVTIGSPPEEIINFVLTLIGDDGLQYHLQDYGTKKQTGVIQKLFAALGKAWPDGSITVKADATSRTITDVPGKGK
jgi:hypothetical protein